MENNENKVSLTDVTFTGEAEVHSPPVNQIVMSEAKVESTPVRTKVKELSRDDIFNFMKTMLENMNTKFDELINDIKGLTLRWARKIRTQ